MPPRRTFRRRRPTRRYRSKRGGVWNIAKKAASKIVKYYLNPEYKYLDNEQIVTPVLAGTVVPDISLIANGDTDTDRDGNSIKLTSQMFRGTVTKNAAATSTKFRLVMFSDVSSAGSTPSATDVLQNIGGGSTDLINSPVNRLNGARFHIWYDHTWVLDSDNPKRHIQFYKKMQHHIHYLDGTAASSALGQGALYLLAISDEAANWPSFTYTNRFRFLDN